MFTFAYFFAGLTSTNTVKLSQSALFLLLFFANFWGNTWPCFQQTSWSMQLTFLACKSNSQLWEHHFKTLLGKNSISWKMWQIGHALHIMFLRYCMFWQMQTWNVTSCKLQLSKLIFKLYTEVGGQQISYFHFVVTGLLKQMLVKLGLLHAPDWTMNY